MLHSASISKGLGAIMGIILGSALAVSPAMAALITFNFAGTVDHAHADLSPPFDGNAVPPQSMFGSITVDNGDTNIDPTIGHYPIQTPPVITDFKLNINGYTATMNTLGSGNVEIINGPGLDRFNVTVNTPIGSNVNFLGPRIFEIELRGPETVFGSDALPTPMPPPSIGDFTNFNQWRLVFGPGPGIGTRVSGPLTSLTAVPLPAAVILFGAGLVALVGLGAGSWRQR
jgi:hypothetical protein